MDTFTPIVITSKKADEHLATIRAKHADILQGMQNQAQRVSAYNQAKVQSEQDRQMKTEEARVQAQKTQTETSLKQQELAMKMNKPNA